MAPPMKAPLGNRVGGVCQFCPPPFSPSAASNLPLLSKADNLPFKAVDRFSLLMVQERLQERKRLVGVKADPSLRLLRQEGSGAVGLCPSTSHLP